MSSQAALATPPNRTQFNLRSLMLGVSVVCVICAFIAVPPLLALVSGVIYAVLTGVLAITIWKGRGWAQAFSVGAILPHAASVVVALNSHGAVEFVLAWLALELLACVAGIGSAAYHGFLARRQGTLPVPDLPFIRDWFSNEGPQH